MATLTGTQIKNTYDSLLKIEDNDGISSSTKLITDGLGNATPLSMSTSRVISSVDIQASSFSTPGGLATDALMANGTTASFPSGNQILDWTVAIPGSVIHNSNLSNLYSGFRIAKGGVVQGIIGNGMVVDFKNGSNTAANVVDDITNSNSISVSFDAENNDWDDAYTHSNSVHAPTNAEANVQSNWNSTSGDSLILNKPTIPSGNSIIDWTIAQPGGNVIHASNYTSGGTSLSGGTNNYVPLWNGSTALDSSVIAQSGSKIGIGESSPSETLVVREGTSDSSIKVLSYNNATGTESAINFATVASGASYVKGGIAFRNAASSFGRGDMHFLNDGSADSGSANTTNDTKMIIRSDGDVGIGTSAPDSKLHIYANNANAPTVLTIENGDTGVVAGQDLSKIDFLTSDVSAPGAGVAASIRAVCQNAGNIFDLAFNVQNGATRTERMRLDGAGNLGIGTTDPKSKLQVVGLSSYASNAAAISGGLTTGSFYHTAGTLKVVI